MGRGVETIWDLIDSMVGPRTSEDTWAGRKNVCHQIPRWKSSTYIQRWSCFIWRWLIQVSLHTNTQQADGGQSIGLSDSFAHIGPVPSLSAVRSPYIASGTCLWVASSYLVLQTLLCLWTCYIPNEQWTNLVHRRGSLLWYLKIQTLKPDSLGSNPASTT